jgi:hypothetical protein
MSSWDESKGLDLSRATGVLSLTNGGSGSSSLVGLEGLIASLSAANLNTTNKQTIYTVPTGKTLIVTKIITRNVSTSLTTVIFGFGFNANANDVIAAALHTTLTGSTLMTIDVPIAGAIVGAAANVLGVKCSLAQGGAATATIDVFGYLI